jgi:hypothetical protein
MFANMTTKFVLSDALPGSFNNRECYHFAPLLRRYAYCSRIGDGWVLMEQILDLTR